MLMVKNLSANTEDIRDVGSISGSGRYHGGEHGSWLQYFCQENPTSRGTWGATSHRAAQNQTQKSMTYVLEEMKTKTLLALPSQVFPEVFLGVRLIFSILKWAVKPWCNINRYKLVAGDRGFYSRLSLCPLSSLYYGQTACNKSYPLTGPGECKYLSPEPLMC